MIQEKLKLPTENDMNEEIPSSSHQLISYNNHEKYPSRDDIEPIPSRFSTQFASSPSSESLFRQPTTSYIPQENFYLQHLRHPSLPGHLQIASPSQIEEYGPDGEMFNRLVLDMIFKLKKTNG